MTAENVAPIYISLSKHVYTYVKYVLTIRNAIFIDIVICSSCHVCAVIVTHYEIWYCASLSTDSSAPLKHYQSGIRFSTSGHRINNQLGYWHTMSHYFRQRHSVYDVRWPTRFIILLHIKCNHVVGVAVAKVISYKGLWSMHRFAPSQRRNLDIFDLIDSSNQIYDAIIHHFFN